MANQKQKLNMNELYEKARSGESQAQYELARLYILGEDTRKDLVEGVKWLSASAKQDNPEALLMLGEQTAKGEGVTKDLKLAFSYYVKATQLDHPDASYRLGLFLIYHGQKINEGESLIRKSAIAENPEAQYELALLYLNGLKSNSKNEINTDYEEAIRWLKKAAEKKHLKALNELGYLFAQGSSDGKIRPNENEAIKYWTAATESYGLDAAEAKYNLAIMYAKKAVELWSQSAQEGIKKSEYMLKLAEKIEWT